MNEFKNTSNKIGTCISSNSLYFIANKNHYIKVEDTIISYQFTNNKLFRLNNNAIIQLFNGYYFMNSRNRTIGDTGDYSKTGTTGYICSNIGDCYLLNPGNKIKYFPDYNSEYDGIYNLLKYDPENLITSHSDINSIQKEKGNNNGFEIVNEEGIFKLDHRFYAECEFNEFDEIECHGVNRIGIFITNDDEVISCSKNDGNTVDCVPVIDGGYYVINNILHECDPNVDSTRIICQKLNKEGYFISSPNEILYECLDSKLFTNSKNNPILLNIMEIDEKIISTEFDETPTTDIEEVDNEKEITCKPIDCQINDMIHYKTDGKLVEMYQCKYIVDYKENKWISIICNSGNYVRNKNGFFQCEDEKDNISKKYIIPPNAEHTTTFNDFTSKITITPSSSSAIFNIETTDSMIDTITSSEILFTEMEEFTTTSEEMITMTLSFEEEESMMTTEKLTKIPIITTTTTTVPPTTTATQDTQATSIEPTQKESGHKSTALKIAIPIIITTMLSTISIIILYIKKRCRRNNN